MGQEDIEFLHIYYWAFYRNAPKMRAVNIHAPFVSPYHLCHIFTHFTPTLYLYLPAQQSSDMIKLPKSLHASSCNLHSVHLCKFESPFTAFIHQWKTKSDSNDSMICDLRFANCKPVFIKSYIDLPNDSNGKPVFIKFLFMRFVTLISSKGSLLFRYSRQILLIKFLTLFVKLYGFGFF